MTPGQVGILALVVGCGSPAPKRVYEEARALGDGSLLLTWSDNTGRSGISRVDRSARIRWSTNLDGEPQGLWATVPSILIGDGIATARTRRQHDEETTALLEAVNLETGTRLWTTTLGPIDRFTRIAGLDGSFLGYASGDSIHPYLAGPDVLVEIDAQTGRERARTSLSTTWAPVPYRHGMVLHGDTRAVAVNGSTATELESRGLGCVIDGTYWSLVEDRSQWRLQPRADDHPPAIGLELVGHPSLAGCASYGDRFVMFLKTEDVTELRIVARDGVVTSKLNLGLVDWSLSTTQPLTTHASGPLTRFVPLLVFDDLSSRKRRLTVVDLQAGRIQWTARAHPPDNLFRADGRWYWIWRGKSKALIAIIDGETGLVTRAVVVSGRFQDVTPSSIAGGSLWIVADGWTGADSIVRLDAATLTKVAGSGRFGVTDGMDDPELRGVPHI